MLSVLLAQNIGALLLMVLAGYVLVKTGLIDHSASKPLSVLLVYVLFPCAIVVYFEVDYSYEVLCGLALSCVAGLACLILQIVIARILVRPLHLNTIEHTSAIYSNCGNLIFPLVAATLGNQWVIYSLPYNCITTAFMFTHGQSIISGKSLFSRDFMKSVLLNPSIIGIFIGIVLFFTGWRLPYSVNFAAQSLGAMLGPVAMLVTGIGIACASPKDIFANKRVWGIASLRLVALPLVICMLLKAVAPLCPVADAGSILLVTLLAAAAPCASTMVQFAVLYGKDDVYASAINVVSTLSCIVTMPLIVWLYLL